VRQIDYEGVRKYHDPLTGIDETLVDPHKSVMIAKERRSLFVTRLMPRTVYSFNISAKFIDGSWGPATNLHTETSSDGRLLLVLDQLYGGYDYDSTSVRRLFDDISTAC